jgi:hypothetical protein
VDLAHLRRVRDLMDRHYVSPIDITAIARVAFMSPPRARRGLSRVEAARMLSGNGVTITFRKGVPHDQGLVPRHNSNPP